MSASDPAILVNVSFTLPQTDRAALADHLAPLMHAAILVGGDGVRIGLQPYDPDAEEET